MEFCVFPILRRGDSAIEKIRAHQNRGYHLFDPGVESARSFMAGVVEGHQPIYIFLGDGPAEGTPGEILSDALGAGALLLGHFGLADEQLLPAGCAGGARGRVRPYDLYGSNQARQTQIPLESKPIILGAARNQVVGCHTGALDERHDDFVHTGRHLQGDIGEALHELGSRRCTATAIHEHAIRFTADLFPEGFLAIDQHDHGCLVLDPAWVEPEIEVRDSDAVLAVRPDRVLEPRAAPCTERHAVHIAILVAGSGGRERGFDDLWHRLAYCHARDYPRDIDVLLQE